MLSKHHTKFTKFTEAVNKNTDGLSKHRLSPYNAHCLNYNFFTHTEQYNGALSDWAKLKQFELYKNHLNADNNNDDDNEDVTNKKYLHHHGTRGQADRLKTLCYSLVLYLQQYNKRKCTDVKCVQNRLRAGLV